MQRWHVDHNVREYATSKVMDILGGGGGGSALSTIAEGPLCCLERNGSAWAGDEQLQRGRS